MPNHGFSRRDVLKLTGSMAVMGIVGGRGIAAEPTPTVRGTDPEIEPDGVVHGRLIPQLPFPLVDCQGTARECGEQLGCLWKGALTLEAERAQGSKPWWKSPRLTPLVAKYCPHLPDIYCGMAKGAGVDEDTLGDRVPSEAALEGCTSFALAPEATLEGIPISGQNKDVAVARGRELLVLRMRMSDAPSMLTLTYTGSGCLFGHGFVRGGTAIFRNSLYIEKSTVGLPYPVWALLALHCPSADEAVELAERYKVQEAFHVVVTDERGGIAGIEGGQGGIACLRPTQGIYVHGNAVLAEGPLRATEKDAAPFRRADSLHRGKRLMDRLQADRGRLTAPLAYSALGDHDGYPVSVCRHQSVDAHTAAAVIAEPTRGLLHVTRGAPCQSWPQTFSLG
jgi:isopenicillin-N N-acyltransferase-like protein